MRRKCSVGKICEILTTKCYLGESEVDYKDGLQKSVSAKWQGPLRGYKVRLQRWTTKSVSAKWRVPLRGYKVRLRRKCSWTTLSLWSEFVSARWLGPPRGYTFL
jgi:hypothetical protein